LESPPLIPYPAPPPAATVLENIPCRNCGYNLRTLARDGVCPECAAPVADSLHVEFLRAANPQWLKKIGIGVRIVFWSLTATILFGTNLFGFRFGGVSPVQFYWIPVVTLCVGIWLATAPNPADLIDAPEGTLRRGTRALALSWPVGAAMRGLFAYYGAWVIRFESQVFITTVIAVAEAASITTLMLYLRSLALRFPDEDVAGGLRRAAWAYLAIFAAGPLMSLWFDMTMYGSRAQPSPSLVMCYNLAIHAQIIALIIFLQAIAPFSTALKRESRR
jgi:hypothetical protein